MVNTVVGITGLYTMPARIYTNNAITKNKAAYDTKTIRILSHLEFISRIGVHPLSNTDVNNIYIRVMSMINGRHTR